VILVRALRFSNNNVTRYRLACCRNFQNRTEFDAEMYPAGPNSSTMTARAYSKQTFYHSEPFSARCGSCDWDTLSFSNEKTNFNTLPSRFWFYSSIVAIHHRYRSSCRSYCRWLGHARGNSVCFVFRCEHQSGAAAGPRTKVTETADKKLWLRVSGF